MPSGVKFFVLRAPNPNTGQVIGQVIDAIDGSDFGGTEAESIGKMYSRVVITDMNLDDDLVQELISGEKRIRKPDINDPFYQILFANGVVTASKATLLTYVENV